MAVAEVVVVVAILVAPLVLGFAAGDLGFLAVVSAFVVGLAWVASRAGRRLAARRV